MRAITFSGLMTPDGTMEVEPGFVVDVDRVPDEIPDGFELLSVFASDQDGTVLAATQLPLVIPCAPPGSGQPQFQPAPVAYGVVACPDGTAALRAELDEKVLWERSVSNEPLRVEVKWPERVSRKQTRLSWRASVSPAMAAVGWVADDSAAAPLSLPTESAEVVVDLTNVAGGHSCHLELLVSDGLRTERLSSPAYELEPGGWAVWILAPPDGAEVAAGQPLTLAAQAYHREEHTVSEAVDWSSSLTGGLGTGSRLPVSLQPGEHIITAAVEGADARIRVVQLPKS